MIGIAYFDQQFRDMIQYTFAPPNPEDPNYFNIAAADARGLELEAIATSSIGLTLRAGYTYLHTEVTDAGFDEGAGASFVEGERLLRRPTHAFSLFVGQEIASRAHVLKGPVKGPGDLFMGTTGTVDRRSFFIDKAIHEKAPPLSEGG